MYTITARAFDGVQYSQEINITIEVNNPEEKTQPSEEPWIWVLIIIVAIVLVLVFVIWFFRKKEPQDMPDDKMFEIIKQKFEDGKISRETFEDFKKRYNKD
jgi:ATP-dependent Zn protease